MSTKTEGSQNVKPTARNAAPRSWYRFAALAASNPTEADLYIYDQIGIDFWTGEGVTAKQFVDDLNALPVSIALIRLHVNCPGGSVFDGIAIANALKNHKAQVNVLIEALAASAATIITMAGDRIIVADNALLMIHNPVTLAWGTAGEMRKAAEMLDTVTDSVLATYAWHSTKSRDELLAMMEATTWMDAEEAVEAGFATEVGESVKAAAQFGEGVVAKLGPVPEKYQARIAALLEQPAEPPTPTPPADPQARPSNVVDITSARERQIEDQQIQRIESINRTFAQIARTHPSLSGGIEEIRQRAVTNRLSLDAASRSLTDFLADQSGPEIVNAVSPISKDSPEPKIDIAAIYDRINARRKGGAGRT